MRLHLRDFLAGDQRAGGDDAALVVTTLVSYLARPGVTQVVAAGISNQEVLGGVVG